MRSIAIYTVLLTLLVGCSEREPEHLIIYEKTLPSNNGLFYKECGFLDDTGCVDKNEYVTLFPSYAFRDSNRSEIVLKIRGWIYESDANVATRFAFLSLLQTQIEENVTEPADIQKRIDPFLTQSESGEEISVQIGKHFYDLTPSSGSGNFEGDIRMGEDEYLSVLEGQEQNSSLKYRVILTEDDHRLIEGSLPLIAEDATLVISDVDDTIKISEVYVSESRLLANTFYNTPKPVPGMVQGYQDIKEQHADVNFFYVSGSPKQLFNTIESFITESGYPEGAVYLREFVLSPVASELYDFFDANASYKHKVEAITSIIDDFPLADVMLIGDTGEKDPEVYSYIQKLYPSQVQKVYLQNVSDENLTNSRLKGLFDTSTAEVKFFETVVA